MYGHYMTRNKAIAELELAITGRHRRPVRRTFIGRATTPTEGTSAFASCSRAKAASSRSASSRSWRTCRARSASFSAPADEGKQNRRRDQAAQTIRFVSVGRTEAAQSGHRDRRQAVRSRRLPDLRMAGYRHGQAHASTESGGTSLMLRFAVASAVKRQRNKRRSRRFVSYTFDGGWNLGVWAAQRAGLFRSERRERPA